MSLVGIFLDSMNKNGPVLSSLLGGIGFARLFLKLVENGERQLWTVPNLVTAIRICGVAATGVYLLQNAKRPPRGDSTGSVLPNTLSDGVLAALGFGFVALDLLDGALARALNQATDLGARLDGSGDALGTAFLALVLQQKGRMPSVLALHMAAAAHMYPLACKVAGSQRERHATAASQWWARPSAGAMALLAVLAVALPAFASAWPSADFGELQAESAAELCAYGAGAVNLASFGLSYATLAGIPVPGSEPKAKEGADHAHSS